MLNVAAMRQARVAWMQGQMSVEQRVLEQTRTARQRLAFAREQLGQDLAPSLGRLDSFLTRVEKAQGVRQRYVEKHLNPSFVPTVADSVPVMRGEWAWRVAEAGRRAQDDTRDLVHRVVRRLGMREFWHGRHSTPNALLERERGLRTLQRAAQRTSPGGSRAAGVSDDALLRRPGAADGELNAVWERLQGGAPKSGNPQQLYVLRDDRFNATSAGGGFFSVNEGLLKRLKGDPDAVAWVLAHELAHDRHRDLPALLQAIRRWEAVKVQLAQTHASDGSGPDRLAEEIDAAILRIKTRLQHMIEHQADADGLRYAAKSGFDVKGALRAVSHTAVSGLPPEAYSRLAHPAPEHRRAALETIIAKEFGNRSQS